MHYKTKIITIILFSNLIYSCSSLYGTNKPIIADAKFTSIPSSLITNSNENKQEVKDNNIINPIFTPNPSVTPSINEQNSSIGTNKNVYAGGAGTTASTTGLVNNTWIDGNKLSKNDSFKIDSIILTNTSKRIDENGKDNIIPYYSGKDIFITINGTFNTELIKESDMLFENEPNLLQISYIGENIPKTKVLIDDSIVANFISANENEIKIKINTIGIPDFYLKGFHKLTIKSEDKKTEKLIRVGEPVYPQSSLSPSISEISIIKAKDIYYDDEYKSWAFKVLSNEVSWEELKSSNPDTPVAIKIVGKNYMMFNRLIEAKIDGDLAIGHSTAISKDIDDNLIWESIIFIPNRDSFSSNTIHYITYSTPFGAVIRSF